jgi:serine/threonine protein phosphatase PrpC
MKIEIAGRAITGSKPTQEDAWQASDAAGTDIRGWAERDVATLSDEALIVLADGMGGYAGGEVASTVARDSFAGAFYAGEGEPAARLARALAAANQAIAAEKQRDPALAEMGSTLIGAFIDHQRLVFVSVGDSLILRWRDDELHRVNRDHSFGEIADRSALGTDDRERWSRALAETSRHALTLAVTGGPLESSEFGHGPQIATRPVRSGDLLIIASDGLETLDPVQIQNFVRELQPKGVGAVADGLIRAVAGIGGNRTYQDNATVVVVRTVDDTAAGFAVMPPALPPARNGPTEIVIRDMPEPPMGGFLAGLTRPGRTFMTGLAAGAVLMGLLAGIVTTALVGSRGPEPVVARQPAGAPAPSTAGPRAPGPASQTPQQRGAGQQRFMKCDFQNRCSFCDSSGEGGCVAVQCDATGNCCDTAGFCVRPQPK